MRTLAAVGCTGKKNKIRKKSELKQINYYGQKKYI